MSEVKFKAFIVKLLNCSMVERARRDLFSLHIHIMQLLGMTTVQMPLVIYDVLDSTFPQKKKGTHLNSASPSQLLLPDNMGAEQ